MYTATGTILFRGNKQWQWIWLTLESWWPVPIAPKTSLLCESVILRIFTKSTFYLHGCVHFHDVISTVKKWFVRFKHQNKKQKGLALYIHQYIHCNTQNYATIISQRSWRDNIWTLHFFSHIPMHIPEK